MAAPPKDIPRVAPKIALVTAYKPTDVTKWSGIIFYIYQSLLESGHFSIAVVETSRLDLAARAVNKLFRLLGIRLEVRFTTAYALLLGLVTSAKLAWHRPDAVVSIAASTHISFVRTAKPIIYISDATFAAIERLYDSFRAMPAWQRRQGRRNEQRALNRADWMLYPSRWAAESAVRDFGVPPGRIRDILPFGPNIPADLLPKACPPHTLGTGPVRILLPCTDWERKGGTVAVAACQALLDRGIACQLVIVGVQPGGALPGFATYEGFIDKRNPDHMRRYCALLAQSHFLLVPTRAEAFGVVYSEAQAFGLPSLTYAVGGTDSAVIHGVTGITLPLTAPPTAFADAIQALVRQPDTYRRMSAAAYERYASLANWPRWAEEVRILCEDRRAGDGRA